MVISIHFFEWFEIDSAISSPQVGFNPTYVIEYLEYVLTAPRQSREMTLFPRYPWSVSSKTLQLHHFYAYYARGRQQEPWKPILNSKFEHKYSVYTPSFSLQQLHSDARRTCRLLIVGYHVRICITHPVFSARSFIEHEQSRRNVHGPRCTCNEPRHHHDRDGPPRRRKGHNLEAID